MRRNGVLFLIVLILTLAFANVAVAQGQEATPSPDPNCGVSLPTEIQPNALPAGATMLWGCWSTSKATDGVTNVYSVGRLLRFDPGFTLVDSSGTPIDVLQHGFAAVTVLTGELHITLKAPCATTGCDPDTGLGSARVGVVADALNNTWTDLVLDQDTTIAAGQTVLLENVTIELSAGSQGALVSSTGMLVREGGGGCINVCVQFP